MLEMLSQQWDSFATTLGTNDFFKGGLFLGVIGGAVAYARRIPHLIWRYIKLKLTYVASIENTERSYLYTIFDSWLVKSNLLAEKNQVRLVTEGDSAKTVPTETTYWVKHNGFRFLLHLNAKPLNTNPNGPVNAAVEKKIYVIETWIWNKKRVFALLDSAIAAYTKVDTISVYLSRGDYWLNIKDVPTNAKKNLVLDEGRMESLQEDLNRFLKREDWYVENGIPYKRGYLLSGPAGTGKTSAIEHLAVKNKKNICIINPKLTTMPQLISSITHFKKAFFIIEEIDTFKGSQDRNEAERQGKKEKEEDFGFSLHDLLSLLDSSLSPHGSVFFFTTNHPEKLDAALMRKGRIDMHLKFEYASLWQLEKLFLTFFPEHPELAQRFATAVGDRVVPPSDVQEHFLRHPEPVKALENVQELLAERQARAKIPVELLNGQRQALSETAAAATPSLAPLFKN